MKGYSLGLAALSAIALQADARAPGNVVEGALDAIVTTVKSVGGANAPYDKAYIEKVLVDGLANGAFDEAYLNRLANQEDRLDFEPQDRITLPEVLKKCPKIMSGDMKELTCLAKDSTTHKVSGDAIVDLINSGGAVGGILSGFVNTHLGDIAGVGITFDQLKEIINGLDWDQVEKLNLDHMLDLALGTDVNEGLNQTCVTPKQLPREAARVVNMVQQELRKWHSWLKTEEDVMKADEWTINPNGEHGCLVAFDGSDLPFVRNGHLEPEWASNLDFVKADIEWNGLQIGAAHHGFVDVFDRIKDVLIADINEVCGQPWEVTYAGHSRGGGIAQIVAVADYERVQNLQPGEPNNWRVNLVTWGSPRALTEATAEKYDGKFAQTRIMNRNDPVPGLIKQDYAFIGDVYCLDCAIFGRDEATEPDPSQIAAHSEDVYWSKICNQTDPLYIYAENPNKITRTGANCEVVA